MNPEVAVKLGTPAIGSAVFCAAGALAFVTNPPMMGPGAGAGLIVGWLAGHGALQMLYAEARSVRRYEAEVLRPNNTTIIMPPGADGFIPRVTSELSIDDWVKVAGVVVKWKPKNFTHSVIRKAFPGPRYSQERQRDIYTEMVNLLSPDFVGVLFGKGKSYEIVDPVGWLFFVRVSEGSVSPFRRYNIPYTPRNAELLQNNALQSTHTQHTNNIWAGQGI